MFFARTRGIKQGRKKNNALNKKGKNGKEKQQEGGISHLRLS